MRLLQFLFLGFLFIPLIEIYLLIKVGGVLGAIPTIFLVVFTAVLGAALIRHQGLVTYRRAQQRLAEGELPTVAMLEGVVLLIAGALLLTPGFFTDAIGFLLLVPPLRRTVITSLLQHGLVRTTHPFSSRREPPHRHRPNIIEGDYRREDESDKR